jgi:type IV pilus assembly protein PilY1
VWSDSPDGPIVEKGGVAEVIRKGNNPAGATTWNLNRSIYTQPLAGGALAAFSSSSPGLESASGLSSSTIPTLSSMTNFILGQDVNSEYNSPPPPGVTSAPAALTRPSIHGDTIHSRPLPVTYSGSTGVYVYYGANDGMFRSINGATGQEQWAFVAPESYSKLKRLQTQSPLILYPNGPTNAAIPPAPKDYFFDGSIGLYQNADNSSIWIYPSMRRGGRMLYAFDVTSPTSPTFKWKVGCPNLTNDTDCSAVSTASPSSWASGLTSMGQTWSLPNVATRIPGHTGPVIIMGGGYDICEDANTSTPTCTNSKGALVYVIDANTGELLASFPTGYGRSVVADVALIAVTTSGVVDRAYAVDTGGNIFRIDFNAGGPGSWAMKRVAYTNGAGRKFLYAPALFRNTGNFVYLALGSGDREHPLQSQYPYTTPVVNRFYAYRDDLSLSSSAPAINLDDTSEGIINILPGVGCVDANTPISSTILPTSNSHGWFLNLNQYGTGEQTVTSALIVAGMVTFSTNRAVPPVGGSCSTTLGEARGYFLNLINGSGAVGVTKNCGGALSSTFVAGGMPLTPVFANVEIGGQTYPIVIGAVQRQGGANSPISPQQMSHTTGTNRKTLYWKSRVD